MSSVTDTITEIANPILEHHGFYLVDIEYVKERGKWYLRLYIDKPGGIDIEECALISEELSEKLDTIKPDPIPNAYFLEVSSPGAERPIKTEQDLKLAVGQYIHVSLYKKIDNVKIFEGTLLSYDDDQLKLSIKIKTRKKEISIPRNAVASMRLAIEF